MIFEKVEKMKHSISALLLGVEPLTIEMPPLPSYSSMDCPSILEFSYIAWIYILAYNSVN